MKKNNFFQKTDFKKLVIDNSRKTVLQKISSLDKPTTTQTQHDFYRKIEENKQNLRNNGLRAKGRSLKLSLYPKMQSYQKLTFSKAQSKQFQNNFIIEIDKHTKNVQRSQSSTIDHIKNRPNNQKRRRTIVLQNSSVHYSAFSQQILEMYDILNQSFVIQVKSSLYISLKKEKFHQIFARLLEVIAQHRQRSLQNSQNSISLLSQTFQAIRKKLNLMKLSNKASKLSLKSNVYVSQYTRQEYRSRVSQLKQTISELSQKNDQLLDKIVCKKEELQLTTALCKQKHQEVTELAKTSSQLATVNATLQANSQQITQQIDKLQGVLRELKEKTDNLFTFVEKQQEKPILHSVSEAYKQIQSEIYDYASYLQCNSMASSLTWQPKPFRAVEKWVYQQMERVSLFVMSKAESFEDKCERMKEFITSTTRKFRTKDEQMMKITDYKTECIKKYIKMMQKWLQNWELKQQYLVNLRNEFVVQAGAMNDSLVALEGIEFEDLFHNKEFSKVFEKIKQKWKKVQLNYKYGNSFY